jgi:hypothetical protein
MENLAELAADFINTTKAHIFLTGKAGTGKTTFLKEIAQATHKNYLIVAPTGIAALNAQGVTIHSQFLFPFGSYVPEPTSFSENPQSNFFSRNKLARKHPLNSERKQVLRSLDLLIIDEVSMLRADLLDAIDYRLRAAKNNYTTPFGGVQLLLIGDLFQLPPIVKDAEWNVLSNFYASIHFFESRALKESGYTYIELDKVYRQQDETFLQLLNNLRNNACTPDDLALLNKHVDTTPDPKAITLTTHNKQADDINSRALEKLDGKLKRYYAHIEGDFSENLYPLSETLELKEASRVMFTRNDVEGDRYYNGKIATVTALRTDSIEVQFDDVEEVMEVPQHEWTNKKYRVNEKTKEIEEDEVGSFRHYPLKLAWAITVHKSQGLTFDGANLLVSNAFAPGQVYVALSRLRSLDGLHLSKAIPSSAIMRDATIGQMAQTHKVVNLNDRLLKEQKAYISYLYRQAFSLDMLIGQLKYFIEKLGPKAQFAEPKLERIVEGVYEALLPDQKHIPPFMRQLDALLNEAEVETFFARLNKGIDYYSKRLQSHLKTLLLFKERLKTLSKTKTLVTGLEELDQAISLNLIRLEGLEEKVRLLQEGDKPKESKKALSKVSTFRAKLLEEIQQIMIDEPLTIKGKTAKKKKPALPKGATYEETYKLVEEGLSIEEIATKRSLAISTIESHVAKGVGEGRFLADKFLTPSEMVKIEAAFSEVGEKGLNAVYAHMDRSVSFGHLRIVQAGLKKS